MVLSQDCKAVAERRTGSRLWTCGFLVGLAAITATAQGPATDDRQWETPERHGVAPQQQQVQPAAQLGAKPEMPQQAAGQTWREYDIRPFTELFGQETQPEQNVLDWILRETGNDTWFRPPMGALGVDRTTVRVYHTPEVQQQVNSIVQRFVTRGTLKHNFAARLVTIGGCNWRAKALPVLTPINTKTPGLEAWMLAKEDAALLLAELRKRVDFREHSPPNLLIKNGAHHNISHWRPRNYAQSVTPDKSVWSGYQMSFDQIDEGFSIDISPLLSSDAKTAEVVIKCTVNQIEKMEDTWLDVPTQLQPRQRVQVQVPQLATWQIHERFRWSADQVLLISRGKVATPDARGSTLNGIPVPIPTSPPRADAILVIENRGPESQADLAQQERPTPSPRVGRINTRGRY